MEKYGVPEESFSRACIAIDKLDKVSQDTVLSELRDLGMSDEAASALINSLSAKSLEEAKVLLGTEPRAQEGLSDLEQLYDLAEGYGYR